MQTCDTDYMSNLSTLDVLTQGSDACDLKTLLPSSGKNKNDMEYNHVILIKSHSHNSPEQTLCCIQR